MKKRKVVQIYIFSLIFAICVVTVRYKLYEGCFNCPTNSNSSSRKYIYDILQYEEHQVVKDIKSETIQKLEQLQSINSEIVALLEIEGTNINYPLLYSGDNTYYLTHNYKKEKSKDGALMLDKDCNLLKQTTNILIYGHNNIGSNEMFADLIKYKNKEFYNNHKTIKFTTNTEESVYEIIFVFLSKVYNKSQTDVFKYYFFINAENKQHFDNFISNCKNLSLYDTHNTAEYGDQLMTLSTCEYSRLNGRLAVVAKKIK
ncbi:MAG: class B sortase [Clostridia bacterium]|nr:class B sortase [Clostridia bacterium]